MQSEKIKEDLSKSYISALCAYAGIGFENISHDDDSTDILLKKDVLLDGCRKYIAELRVQLKCTSSPSQYTDNGDTITYKLKAKNYNDLCAPSTSPIILCLLVLPENKSEWIKWSTEELLMKGCMYWASFSGNDESENVGTVSVAIDKAHVVNYSSLDEILKKIAREEWQ